MKQHYKLLTTFLVLASFLFSFCADKKNPYVQDLAIENFKKLIDESVIKNNPDWALALGNHEFDDVIEIPSRETQYRKENIYKSLLDSLNKYDWKKISPENSIDARMMISFLEEYDWRIHEFKSYEWNPAEYNVGEGFDLVLGNPKRPLDGKLLTVSDRLNYVPAYYITAKSNIHRPTKEHTQLAILQNQGTLEMFEKNIPDSIAQSRLSDGEKEELNTRLAAAVVSLREFISFLNDISKQMDADSTYAKSFRIGKAMYEKKFRYEMQSCFSVDQIYQMALDHKKEVHEKMTALTKELWKKYFGEAVMPSDLSAVKMMIDTLSLQHCTADSFISTIRNQIPELESFIRKKDLLTLDATKPLIVRETPQYMRGSGAGASINAPGPFDKNASTFYNVTPLDNYTPEKAESYLREYNNWILQILNIHEAIPGHYAQLVYSNKGSDLIKSLLQNNAMIEGWAVYGERMMLEEGYGNNSPEMWLMYYKWHLRSTVNTILDYSIHCLDLSEQDALSLMINEGFQTEAEAHSKWRRATLSQIQLLCYFTGFTEIYLLRDQMKKEKGNDFNLKSFHEKFLSYGSVPIKYIWEMMVKKKN